MLLLYNVSNNCRNTYLNPREFPDWIGKGREKLKRKERKTGSVAKARKQKRSRI